MHVHSYLRENGLRVTPQRELIIRVLQGTKKHPTAEVLFEKVRESYPALSLNTVYKALELFEEKGMIKRFNVGVNIYRYDANVTPHAHIICVKCDRVDDIEEDFKELLAGIKDKKEEKGFKGYEVLSANFFINGICPDCKKGGEGRDGGLEM